MTDLVPLLVLAITGCLLPMVAAFVVEEPFQENLFHVPAAFGPDVQDVVPPLLSRRLSKAFPCDACTPLTNSRDMEGGAIALVERGGCNFTQKVIHAQLAGAAAVVVTDSKATDQWAVTMSGVEEGTRDIHIPSVFISHTDGEKLWGAMQGGRARSGGNRWREGAGGGGVGDAVVVTLNGVGRVPVRGGGMGLLEALGVYILVSFLLVGVSGVFGVVIALSITCYRRSYRSRAMRKLPAFKYQRVRAAPTNSRACDESSEAINESSRAVDESSSQGSDAPPLAHQAASNPLLGKEGKDGSKGSGVKEQVKTTNGKSKAGSSGPDWKGSSARGCGHKAVGNGACDRSSGNAHGGRERGMGEGTGGQGLTDRDHDMCAICLDAYEEGEALTALPCRHAFHTACIRPWLTTKSRLCPMCKGEAFPPQGAFGRGAASWDVVGNGGDEQAGEGGRDGGGGWSHPGIGGGLEPALEELTLICSENIHLLGVVFFASLSCGVLASNLLVWA